MSRIRSVKPETWISESLAEVSVTAERTFLAMTNHADDHGRHRDNAAIIAGLVWPLRAEHTAVHVEDDLTQLADAGLICRYTGCDGRRYFHYPTWSKHQKIDKPSPSRLPACPRCAPERCGVCQGPCTQRPHPQRADSSMKAPGRLPEGSLNPPRGFLEDSPEVPGGLREDSANLSGALEPPARPSPTPDAPTRGTRAPKQDTPNSPEATRPETAGNAAGHTAFAEPSPKGPRILPEGSAPGSRIKDPGSSIPTGRDAPGAGSVSAKELVAEYVAACGRRPPGEVVGHLGRIVKKLLDEGIPAEYVRAGLQHYAEIQGHPSRLPSLVNDAMNAPGGPGAGLARPRYAPTVPAHTAWTNPVDAAAYSEEL
ncbi:hypothetical protein [Actinacidiphila acididurans]|uniref:Uncharacterized protein n=1 Tax=Actinacidiphila acididurans TaxID=2784346 RepID=A0ABS2TYG7_9ACTN|nr:hypothetical protein [Actinacidiphila acididurans]MBM9508036.1 hypothetical protein [Actinacidiphila acididurans]